MITTDESDQVMQAFPNFPDLGFEEYYKMIHIFSRENRLDDISPKVDLGLHTIQFIQFHFKNPRQTLQEIDDAFIDQGRYVNNVNPIVFLHQENLSHELFEFLLSCGYPRSDIGVLLKAERVNVTLK